MGCATLQKPGGSRSTGGWDDVLPEVVLEHLMVLLRQVRKATDRGSTGVPGKGYLYGWNRLCAPPLAGRGVAAGRGGGASGARGCGLGGSAARGSGGGLVIFRQSSIEQSWQPSAAAGATASVSTGLLSTSGGGFDAAGACRASGVTGSPSESESSKRSSKLRLSAPRPPSLGSSVERSSPWDADRGAAGGNCCAGMDVLLLAGPPRVLLPPSILPPGFFAGSLRSSPLPFDDEEGWPSSLLSIGPGASAVRTSRDRESILGSLPQLPGKAIETLTVYSVPGCSSHTL
eukprot:CAMPEP_0171216202 /NCGR_PEP_ID=MMETSP0790-20130122/32059_1 /TAXON_ID=2925 /ORGANISM="Alexandrium catenella, Strain OF101" /LENGTH=287 /DNA_ID=CAMNT_0011681975 /DNA_START=97 /DNA_END=961 /DNA_ORIENTATION=+